MLRKSIVMCACALLLGCGADNEIEEVPQDTLSPMTDMDADDMDGGRSVSVSLSPTEGNTATGNLTLTEVDDGVRVEGRLTGLPADRELGFHVHQVADCSGPNASAAGDHLNPMGGQHGDPDSEQSHLGDMPNLDADEEGVADVDVTVDRATLEATGDRTLLDRAIVVHGQQDDYETQPSGGSGDPIACGEIPATANAATGAAPTASMP